MNQGGRPVSVIWEDFLRISENGKVQAKCKICGHVLSGKAERMKAHIKKCKDKVQDCVTAIQAPALEAVSLPKRPRVQSEMQSFFVMTDSKTKHALDLQVAKFFYACNIPFLVSENPEFVQLCSLLRPGYAPPNRKLLAEGLLDKVYNGLETKMKEEIEGKEGTLVEDGWSNIHNDPVIASSLVVDGKSYFLRAMETGSHSKTAEYCQANAENSIKESREKYGCTVRSFVTDNARNMEKMRNQMQKEDNGLLVYGCSAHWLNLLGHDITPCQIMKPVVDVQKFFRNHHLPSAWLKESLNTVKPQLPNDTRWNSNLTCLETFLKNRHAYMKISEEHSEYVDSRIQKLVNDFNLFKQVKDLCAQLKPIASALDSVQRDTCSLSDACHEWLTLTKCEELKLYNKKVQERMKQALTPFHFLAYMSHPYLMGELLNEEQREEARQWLLSCQPENLEYFKAFEAKSPPFPESFF